jgi:hypothetical protein
MNDASGDPTPSVIALLVGQRAREWRDDGSGGANGWTMSARRRSGSTTQGPAAQQPGQGGEQHSVGRLEIRSVNLTAEHRDLVAQHEDLDLLRSVTAQHQNQELQDAAQRVVRQRPKHGR